MPLAFIVHIFLICIVANYFLGGLRRTEETTTGYADGLLVILLTTLAIVMWERLSQKFRSL